VFCFLSIQANYGVRKVCIDEAINELFLTDDEIYSPSKVIFTPHLLVICFELFKAVFFNGPKFIIRRRLFHLMMRLLMLRRLLALLTLHRLRILSLKAISTSDLNDDENLDFGSSNLTTKRSLMKDFDEVAVKRSRKSSKSVKD